MTILSLLLPSFLTLTTRRRVRPTGLPGQGRPVRHGDLVTPAREGAGCGTRTASTCALGAPGAMPAARVARLATNGPAGAALPPLPEALASRPAPGETMATVYALIPVLRGLPEASVIPARTVPPAAATDVTAIGVAAPSLGAPRPNQEGAAELVPALHYAGYSSKPITFEWPRNPHRPRCGLRGHQLARYTVRPLSICPPTRRLHKSGRGSTSPAVSLDRLAKGAPAVAHFFTASDS